MREITYYIADDGTQFRSEDECMEYELNTRLIESIEGENMSTIHIWNDCFEPLDITSCKTIEDVEDILNNTHFVVGTDTDALNYLFSDLGYDHFGICGYPDNGMKANVRYYYDIDDLEYKEFDKKYGKIIEFNDKFKVGE